MRRVTAFVVTVMATVVMAATTVGAYMPNPQPVARDRRPPVVKIPARPFAPFTVFPAARSRNAIVGRFFTGYDRLGRRVCWVVYADGTEGLAFDVC